MAKEVQRNVVIICGSNKRTLRYVPPLAKVMPHRAICGAFFTFGTKNATYNHEVVGFAPSLTEN